MDAEATEETEVQQVPAEAGTEGQETEKESGAEVSEAESESSPEEKPKRGVGKRLDELTRNWRETERERDYWRQLATQRQEQPKPEEPVKSLEDFNYDDKAYQKYLFDAAEKRAVEAAKNYARQENQERETQRRKHSYTINEVEFAKKTEDFYEVTRNPQLEISESMAEAMLDSEEGPAIAYYLGKNPEIASKLSVLSPIQAAREIGRLESKLIADREALRKKVSEAPKPPAKVEGSSPSVDKNPDTMSTADWLKWRNKQVLKNR